ncbi:MAG: D-glycero-beta-D-manno-heptose-7-phosphate kinase [Deltaproteobacteria bacterium]|nr:D-glycero-beta-D-manno-heptose-7-phosphate kinase [Deltaproteobacteria bacterium]NIS78196.1 D-glycero-beta-D-manno-heptose-7-phosphate kinase [Deltaproteobacteria bacterium]
MDKGKLYEYVERFQGKKALILGDIMLDEYVWGLVDRISPEAPVPVVKIERETRTAGGAGNVALNVKMLGMEAVLAGTVGEDYHGGVIKKILKKNGIDQTAICSVKNLRTVVKTRVVAHSQQMVRMDRENSFDLPGGVKKELIRKLEKCIPEVDFVIVSDYNKGAVSEEVFGALIERSREKGKNVVVDPKKRNVAFYRGCTVIKPNRKEAEFFAGIDVLNEADLIRAGKRIMSKTAASAVLISRGAEGMTLIQKRGKKPLYIPAIAREVYDVTGAGDTVVSVFSAILSAGGGYEDSALVANIAAAVVVGEVGTSPITREKLIKAIKRYDAGNLS